MNIELQKGSKLYIRIDYKTDSEMTHQDFQDHLTCVKKIAGERYFLGGGFGNIDGGMILMEAESIEDAEKIFHNDPIIEKGIYRCEVFVWELAVLSEDIGEQ